MKGAFWRRGLGGNRLRLTVLGVFITLAMAALYGLEPPVITPFFKSMEGRLLDLRFNLRGVKKPTGQVVVAALDEKSLQEVGRWPWPRPTVARLMNNLGHSGAGVVGLDMGFFETDSSLAVDMLKTERGGATGSQRSMLDRLIKGLSGDDLLAQSFASTAVPMVVGYFFHMNSSEVGFIDQAQRHERRKMMSRARYKFIYLPQGVPEASLPIPTGFAPEPNLPQINQAAPFLGYFNTLPDADGKIRSLPMVIRQRRGKTPQDGYDYFLPLTVSMLKAYLGGEQWAISQELAAARHGLAAALKQGRVSQAQADEVTGELDAAGEEIKAGWSQYDAQLHLGLAGVRYVQVGDLKADTSFHGELLLNFRGPGHTFSYVSWSDILNGRLPEGALKGKLVVVGASATGVGDVRPTPFDPVMPGPELQATALDNLLTGDWLVKPDWARGVDLACILGLGLLASLLMPSLSAPAGLVLYFILAGGFVGFNHFYAFMQNRMVLTAIFPLLTLSTVFMWIVAWRFIMEERERRQTRRAFSYYLSDHVIEQVLKDPDMLKLGGQLRELTIFFSDLESFTSLSEGLEPEELTSLLNEFLSEMTDIILDEEGTLDKYEGDAIIAFWNAPLDHPDHALRACRAAIRCQRRLAELQDHFKEIVGRGMLMRIGINTGQVVVGNMGSAKRFDYTFLGDAGNLAARLEGANKALGTYLMVSQYTWEQAKDGLVGRELGELVVVGKTESVRVYEPLGLAGEEYLDTPEAVHFRQAYAQGLESCRQGDWPQAVEAFCKLPDDAAAMTYAQRGQDLCEGRIKSWDGVWNLTRK